MRSCDRSHWISHAPTTAPPSGHCAITVPKTPYLLSSKYDPKAQQIKMFDTKLEKWSYTKMCVSWEGRIIFSGKIGDEHWLKPC